METQGNEHLPGRNPGKRWRSREVNMVLGAAFSWGTLQILEKGADTLKAKQYFLKCPELKKTKFEV